MSLATKASDPFVPEHHWIATLSDGRTIYENRIPGEISGWRKLQKLVENSDIRITSLRLQAYGSLINMPKPEIVSGYWQVSRITKSVSPSGTIEKTQRGIGYIRDDVIDITWVDADGNVDREARTYDLKKDLAGILHD